MSRDRNAGRGHSVKIDNTSIERVEEFKYLGTTLTDQNSIQEEIKSRLKLGNACYHSVQNLLSSRLLSKNLNIKIYRTIILPVVLYGCETWSLTLIRPLACWDLGFESHRGHGCLSVVSVVCCRVEVSVVCCECRVLSGRGLSRPEESYRLCCVVVCDLETSRMGAPYIYIWH